MVCWWAVGSFWPKAGGALHTSKGKEKGRKGGKKKASKLQVVTRHSTWMIPKWKIIHTKMQ
jgi:hypothetical protein